MGEISGNTRCSPCFFIEGMVLHVTEDHRPSPSSSQLR